MSVLVVAQQQDQTWHKMSWEALAAARRMAPAAGGKVVASVMGDGVEPLAAELGEYAAEALAVDHALLKDYTPDGYCAALRQVIGHVQPQIVLFPHTYQVRDFGPKLATSLGKAFVSDVVDIRNENGQLVFVRQLFQGKVNADVTLSGEPPFFVSVQSGAFRADTLEKTGSPAPARKIEISLSESEIRTKPLAPFRESKGEVDLSSAGIIVSVGRGIKDPENIPLAEELARVLGAEIGASRPICDSGWLPLERQIGSSGQTVSPKIYFALGISGAIQHVVGMKGAKTIVAINQDSSAPIFEIADYGIVGDLFEIVPALTQALKESGS